MTIEGLTITHHDNGDSGKYVAEIVDTEATGKLTWKKRPSDDGQDIRVADHTIVPREIGGRGVAASLVDALVADAREHGFKIVPQCSYVADKFDDNPQWSDLRA